MKSTTQRTRGFEPSVQQAESVEEFDTIAGGAGSALAFANAEATYRSILPKAWKLVSSRAKELFGVEREITGTRTLKDGTEANVLEKDATFFKRLINTVEHDDLAALLQTCCDEVGFDVSKNARTKKPGDAFYESAKDCIAKVASDDECSWESFEEGTQAAGATTAVAYEEDGSVDIDSIATILQEVFKASTPAF